ncbi:hypothetical protein [Jatrophihabitans sp. GAS493]|uniref:hypothetical protein n=1 Tax=Jatrophihabitans sp. GAS493 TaxID=1907575 RepID=UPI000BB9AA6C|nr:hypothetical protein [Jatrophihabitans sp. GAS493]
MTVDKLNFACRRTSTGDAVTPFNARHSRILRASRMLLGAAVAISATTTAAVYLSAGGAAAVGNSDAPNPVQLGYDCAFPGATSHSITALVAWAAGGAGSAVSSSPSSTAPGAGSPSVDSSVRLTSVSLILSAEVVDELRQLHAASVGGVFGPQVSPSSPTSTSTLAALLALPATPGTPLALVGGWLGGAPTFSYASSTPYSLKADSFVLQLAAATADGTSVSLPASVVCTTTPGRDNTIFTHTARVCAGGSIAAPGGTCTTPSPRPATPTPSHAPATTPAPGKAPTPTPVVTRTSALPAPSAAAPPVVATTYSLTGIFTLPSVSGSGRLGPGTLRVRPASADGRFTGSLTVPPAVIDGTLFGFVPITVTAAFTPVGAVTGRVSANLSATAESVFSVALKSVKLFGLLPVTSSECRTKAPVKLHLASGGAGTFNPATGGGLSGQLSIGEFTGCGVATNVLNAVVPGAGSSVTFSVLHP